MAVGDAYVFPGFLKPVLTQLFFQKSQLLFSHASAEVRGENTPERKVASTGDQTQPPGRESDTLTTEPPRQGTLRKKALVLKTGIQCFRSNKLTHSHTMTPFDAPGKQAF